MSAAARAECTGQPISWLALERHALGELEPEHTAKVSSHLDGCTACREALGVIEADRGHRVLPPLPDLAVAAAARRRRAGRQLAAGAAVALAAAAALLLFWRGRNPEELAAGSGIKGGDALSLSLVRERGGEITHDPTSFDPDDRFKALVTCALPGEVSVTIVVRQGGAIDRPLPPARIRCGNRVVLPGAFRLTAREPASICAAAGMATDCRVLNAESPE